MFKEEGKYLLTLLFPEAGGDLGPFRFTKAAPYKGTSVDISAIALFAKFVIYPNPTTGEINIELADAEVANVEIINMVGQIVYSSKVQSRDKINADLCKVSYILRIKTADSIQQQNLIVK